jgi:hypothetical protein
MNIDKTKDTLEIFSGSLLEKRREWQQVKCHLPPHTYLLVTPLNNPTRTSFILRLGQALREAGIRVMVLSIG